MDWDHVNNEFFLIIYENGASILRDKDDKIIKIFNIDLIDDV